MATKMDPNLCPNRGQAACAGMVDNIFVFFEFLGRFWEPFGSQFGAKSLEKHIQKYIRKSVPKKYGKSWERAPKTMPKCGQMVTQS